MKTKRPEILAAGTVLIKRVGSNGAERLVCLVHRPTHQDWSLPKGKLDPGEHVIAAAWRETVEETGEHVVLGPPLPPHFYLAEGKLKRVDYWVGHVVKGGPGFRSNREIDELAWLSPAEAAKKLTYRRDRDLIKGALRAPLTSPLIVLRHGTAMQRARWGKRDDSKRPLAAAGRRQATELSNVLAGFGIRSLHSSDAKRCLQTLQPFAAAASVKIVTETAISERGFQAKPGRAAQRMDALLAMKQPLVICTHRPLLPDLLRQIRRGLKVARSDAIDEPLPPGGLIVFHRRIQADKRVRAFAVERHEL